jgi:hypothetical protein
MADTHSPVPHASSHRADARAAFTGLLVGVVALFLLVTTVVLLTSRHYGGEKPAAAEAHN